MLSTVTNRGRGARGFSTLDRGVVLLDPEASAVLDLADHPSHRAWSDAGQVLIVPLPEKDAKAARRRMEAETEATTRAQAQALEQLARPRRDA